MKHQAVGLEQQGGLSALVGKPERKLAMIFSMALSANLKRSLV